MLADCRTIGRALLLTAAALGVLGESAVVAQQTAGKAAPARPAAAKKSPYEELNLPGISDPKDWKLKKTNLMAEGKVAEGAAGQEDEKVFMNHYKLLVAEMTHWSQRGNLHIKRTELKKDLNGFGRAPDKSLYTKLRDLMFGILPKIFTNPKYSPAARFNTLLAFGDLNQEEGDIGGNGCVPLPKALPGLIAVLKNQDAKNPLPAYLQVAALAGVTRHMMSPKSSVTPEGRKEIAQVLAGWLRKPPADGLSVEVQNYLRRRAADVLRLMAEKGNEANTADVANALAQFAADEEAPLDDRCEAIRTLGGLDSKTIGEKNVPVVARTIAILAAEVGRQTAAPAPVEAPAVVADEAPTADGDAPAAPAGDAPAADAPVAAADGDGPVAPPAAAPVPPAAELPAAEEAVADSKSQGVLPPDLQTYLLLCLRMGLEGQRGRGLSNAATADSKQLVTDLVGKIDEMHKIVGKKKREDRLNDDEIRKLRDLAAGLETLIGHREDGVEGATEQARAN